MFQVAGAGGEGHAEDGVFIKIHSNSIAFGFHFFEQWLSEIPDSTGSWP